MNPLAPAYFVAAVAAAINRRAAAVAACRLAAAEKREPRGPKHPDTPQTHRAYWKRVEKRRRDRKAARLQKIKARNGARPR